MLNIYVHVINQTIAVIRRFIFLRLQNTGKRNWKN